MLTKELPMTDMVRRDLEGEEVELLVPLLLTQMPSTSSEPSLHEAIHSREIHLVQIPFLACSKAIGPGQATQASTSIMVGLEAFLTHFSLEEWVLLAVGACSKISEPPQTVLSVERLFQSMWFTM